MAYSPENMDLSSPRSPIGEVLDLMQDVRIELSPLEVAELTWLSTCWSAADLTDPDPAIVEVSPQEDDEAVVDEAKDDEGRPEETDGDEGLDDHTTNQQVDEGELPRFRRTTCFARGSQGGYSLCH
jgi:hypothetical protein